MSERSEYPHEDAMLVEQCLSGSRTAWNDLYARHVGLVRRAIVKRSGLRGADLEDMVQNVFVKLCTALESFNPRHQLSQFIYVIAERVSIDEHRFSKAAKRSREVIAFDQDGAEQAIEGIDSGENHSQEEQLAKAQLMALVSAAFEELDQKCRQVLRLRYYKELPFKEIAKLLGGTENSITVQARRCLDRLRDLYFLLEQEG